MAAAAEARPQGRAAQRGAQPPEGTPAPGVSPGEIQQMFDAYVLVQAQDVLQLKDDQYAQFVTRLRALQAVRRRHENQRLMIVNQLRRILQAADGRVDETMIQERLKSLDDLRASSLTEIKQAQDSLDEVLDLRASASSKKRWSAGRSSSSCARVRPTARRIALATNFRSKIFSAPARGEDSCALKRS
jgi:hypothetical protein